MASARLLDWILPARETAELDWDRVYSEQLSRVFNYFRYRVLNRATAEDLTSTTFEKAWRARGRYRSDRASVGTWLLSIARNVAIDHFRGLRREVPLEELADLPEMFGSTSPSSARPSCGVSRPCSPRSPSASASCWPSSTARRRRTAPSPASPASASRTSGRSCHRTIATLRDRWEAGGPR